MLDELKSIPVADFEAFDTSSVIIDPTSGAARLHQPCDQDASRCGKVSPHAVVVTLRTSEIGDSRVAEREDFNAKIIDEFRANAGKVGGPFEGAPILLLHHTGAKSGRERVNPLAYQPVGEDFAVFASRGGSPQNPDWYHNLVANPRTRVEVGKDTVEVTAKELRDGERSEIWERQKTLMPGFADYERNTQGIRQIPVILLERSV